MEKTYATNGSRQVTVRPAVKSDADGCISLLARVAAEKVFIMTEEITEGRIQSLMDMIAGNGKEMLFAVAVMDGSVVGTLDLQRISGSPKTDHVRELGMGVMKEYRSSGIGTALMDYAITWSRGHGIEKIVLDVFSTNTAALEFYRKSGFEVEGVGKKTAKIAGKYVDLIRMSVFVESG